MNFAVKFVNCEKNCKEFGTIFTITFIIFNRSIVTLKTYGKLVILNVANLPRLITHTHMSGICILPDHRM